MKELKAKKDFIPLVLVVISSFYYLFITISSVSGFSVKQIAGLLVLALTTVLFGFKLRLGVLALGVFFILSWFGIISISNDNLAISFRMTIFDTYVSFFNGHPVLLVGTFMHFILSGEHYFGLLTKKYWQQLFKEPIDENIQI